MRKLLKIARGALAGAASGTAVGGAAVKYLIPFDWATGYTASAAIVGGAGLVGAITGGWAAAKDEPGGKE